MLPASGIPAHDNILPYELRVVGLFKMNQNEPSYSDPAPNTGVARVWPFPLRLRSKGRCQTACIKYSARVDPLLVDRGSVKSTNLTYRHSEVINYIVMHIYIHILGVLKKYWCELNAASAAPGAPTAPVKNSSCRHLKVAAAQKQRAASLLAAPAPWSRWRRRSQELSS